MKKVFKLFRFIGSLEHNKYAAAKLINDSKNCTELQFINIINSWAKTLLQFLLLCQVVNFGRFICNTYICVLLETKYVHLFKSFLFSEISAKL